MRRIAVLVLLAAAASTAAEAEVAKTQQAAAPWHDQKTAQAEAGRLQTWLDNDDNDSLLPYFKDWASTHKRAYRQEEDEEGRRYAQFKQGLRRIARNNANPNSTFWSAPNEYTDLSWEEFKQRYLGAVVPEGEEVVEGGGAVFSNRKLLQQYPPAEVDWRAAGKVTSVKKQGECLCCWAFAAVAALESQYLIEHNVSLELSVQQIVDCVSDANGYNSNGCSGGWPREALDYMYRFNVTTVDAYHPYSMGKGVCDRALLASTSDDNIATISTGPGYAAVPARSAQALMIAVSSQPTITAFHMEESFMDYAGGIYPASACSNDPSNHIMLVVGYSQGSGVGAEDSYWLIKNSWGAEWGEQGYVRVQMTPDGTPGACSMYMYSYTPLGVRDSPIPRSSAAGAPQQGVEESAGSDGGAPLEPSYSPFYKPSN